MPTVSVVIPTYNRAHLLGRAVHSVLNQTYCDLELIVVDDASVDATADVVNGFADERVRYVRHEKNKGGAAARNTGIMIARGDYVAFQDSDDEWTPEKLEKQMRVFESAGPHVGVVYSGFYRVKDGKRNYIPSPDVLRKDGDIHESLVGGNFVGTPTCVIRKECFTTAGIFDADLPRLQDWELWIRISKRYHFKCVDEPLVIAYFQPDSISADRVGQIKALKVILERHFADMKKNPRILAKRYYRIGKLLRSNGDVVEGRTYLIKSARTYPFSIKYLWVAITSHLARGIGRSDGLH